MAYIANYSEPLADLLLLGMRLLPGIALAIVVGLVSLGIARLETLAFGRPVIEGLVVAILLGMLVRTAWLPPARFDAGVNFTAKGVLEVAVLLLGASVDLPLLVSAGPALAMGIPAIVVLGIATSYAVGRMFGLSDRHAILVACGNSICGNSAIAAVAPVIGAKKDEVASSIAFTAILGVLVVVSLPLLILPLALRPYQYGVLAGLTVSAVPQVLAAAFPVSVLSGQVGTLVKLVRVLMLGPVVLFFALAHRRHGRKDDAKVPIGITRFVPWFIVGFLILASLRSLGLIPTGFAGLARTVSGWLTIAAMAALGLGVDLKSIARVGRPVILTVATSMVILVGMSIGLIRLLSLP